MRQNNLLDVASAAEIIGVESSTVIGWCTNHIINCQDAPLEYADKTKFLIGEDECNYINRLITKYGVRGMLLNYKKCWNTPLIKHEPIKETIAINNSQNIQTKHRESNSDRLVSSILYAHSLKKKIDEFKSELSKLENEYNDLRNYIVDQI